MNNKFWLLIAGVLGVAILAMGWFLGVSPKIDEMSAANEQRANVDEVRIAFTRPSSSNSRSSSRKLTTSRLSWPTHNSDSRRGMSFRRSSGQLHGLENSSGVTLTKFAASDGQRYIAAPGATTNGAVTADNFVAITIDLTVTGYADAGDRLRQ